MDAKQLKQYARQLRDVYASINDKAKDSYIYWNLTQYIEEGRITNMIPRNAKINVKIELINAYTYLVQKFARVSNKAITIETLDAMVLRVNRDKKIDKLLFGK